MIAAHYRIRKNYFPVTMLSWEDRLKIRLDLKLKRKNSNIWIWMIYFYTKFLENSASLNKMILYYDFSKWQPNRPFYKLSLRCECKPCESTPCGPGTRKILISSVSGFPGRCCDLYQCVKLFTGFPSEDRDQTFITPTSCGKLDGALRQVQVIFHF